jgi:hypothetical protein
MPNENNTTTNTDQTFDCENCNETCSLSSRASNDIENYEDVCEDCISSDFRYSDRRDCYVLRSDWDDEIHEYEPEDNYDDDESPESSEHIFAYCSGSFRNTTPLFKPYESESFNNKTLTLGVEDEVQVRSSSRLSRDDLAYNITQNDLKNFAICKEDSSIGYGFEIVSKPATFEYHKTAWDIFFENTAKYLRSYRDIKTGLHIHVNQSFFSMSGVGKILEFINSDINKSFVDDISGRTQTDYCQRNSRLKLKDVKTWRDRGAFNIFVPRTKTHEFRCFSGNVKKESFFKTLEFAVAMCNYSMTECPMYNINYKDFVSYVRSYHFEYPYLFNWLVNKGYLKNRELKRIKSKTIFYNRRRV